MKTANTVNFSATVYATEAANVISTEMLNASVSEFTTKRASDMFGTKMLNISLPDVTPEQLRAAKRHKKINRENSYCHSVIQHVRAFYKFPINRSLYGNYVKMFEVAKDGDAAIDALVKSAICTAGYDAWMHITPTEMRAYRKAFKKLFSDMEYDGLYHKQGVKRAVLFQKASEQSFICPECGEKLDFNIKEGPMQVVGDHTFCEDDFGNCMSVENIQAMHRTCNDRKHTTVALLGGRFQCVKL